MAVASYSAFIHVLWLFWVQYCLFQKKPQGLKHWNNETISNWSCKLEWNFSTQAWQYCTVWWLQNCLSFAKKTAEGQSWASQKIWGQRTHDKNRSEGLMTCFLVGGFNPFEKYSSNWIISPSRDENKLLYFEWSPPWHVGWRLSGEGCHWEYNGEFENIDFRFPWLSDTSEMGFGHDVPFLNYSDRLPHPSDLCQPDRVRWG